MPFVTNNGVRLFWTEQGAGDPVLLVMGHRMTHEMWHAVVPALAERYRVVSFDNRGVGESDSPAGPYSIEAMADDARAVMDAAGIDTAHVYGASMGGMIAQELAFSSPERIRRLVLGCTTPLRPGKFKKAQLIQYYLPVPKPLMVKLSQKLMYGPAAQPVEIAADLEVLAREKSTRTGLVGQAHAMLSYDCGDRLSRVQLPTLVLHGDHDKVIPLAWGKELAEAIPGARLVVLPGAGHVYMTGRRDQANAAVLDFFAN